MTGGKLGVGAPTSALTRIVNGPNVPVVVPLLATMVTSPLSPTSAAVGVPESVPVLVSKVVHEGCPSMAKLLFLNPLAPRLFAWSADKAAVVNLLKGTGSKIGPRGVDLYARLLHNPGHVAGALGMMASWDLTDLRRDLPGLNARVLLIVGENDKAVPPRDAGVVAAEIHGATVETIRRTGHLAHEERPDEVCRIIMRHAVEAGLIPGEVGDSAEV